MGSGNACLPVIVIFADDGNGFLDGFYAGWNLHVFGAGIFRGCLNHVFVGPLDKLVPHISNEHERCAVQLSDLE